MNKSQVFGSFLGLATFSFLVTLAIPAFAEVPPCRDIGNPQIGNTCYNELDINARSGPDDASSDHDEMTAGTGWSVIDWNFRNDAQFGSVEGPKYTFTEKGSAYEMKNSIDEYTRNLEEVRKKAEAEGSGNKYLADYIDKTLKEYENRRSAVSSAQTNVDVLKVDVTVRGRCLRSTLFGCVDKSGGKLQGVVRVYKRYIGTPEATQTFLTETLSKARELAAASVPSQLSNGFYRQLNTPGVYYLSGQDACSVTFEQMNIIGWDKLTDVNRNPAESKNFNGTCTSAILPNGYYRHRGSSGVVRVFGQSACGVTFDQMNAAGWDKVKDIERDPAENRNYIGTCQ